MTEAHDRPIGADGEGHAGPGWDLFICYRQVDGREAAAWLHDTLSGRVLPFVPEVFSEPPRLRVYFDQTAPAVDDWMRIHKPALSRARAFLFVCSPGAYARLGNDDWVHQELDWWIANRDAAPILIDPTGDGPRWVPANVGQRWPNAQRLLLQPALWARLPPHERADLESNLRHRIIGGIRESEQSTTYQDLEREKQRARELERQTAQLRAQRTRLRLYFGAAIAALALAAAAAVLAVRQQRAAESQALQTKASLALATAAGAKDPLAAALLLISADDVLAARGLPVPPGSEAVAHRIARTPRPIALLRHRDRVSAASYSPDGRRIVTASHDGTAKVWNASGLGSPITLSGHEGAVFSAEFDPAGDRVVTASDDGTARLWNAADGTPLSVLRGHQRSVLGATFSPDGRRVVTASDDRTARIWMVDESHPAIVLADHDGVVRTAVFDRSGEHVLTASDPGSARVWKADGSRTPPVDLERPLNATVAASGAVTISVSRAGFMRALFSPDGRQVIAAAGEGAFIWNADGAGQPIQLVGAKDENVGSSSFSPDGRLAATGSFDGVTRVWKLGTREPPVVLGQPLVLAGAGASLGGAAHPRIWSPDSRRVLGVSPNGTVTASSIDGTETLSLIHDAAVVSAEFSPDGSQIVTACVDGTARIWSARPAGEPVILTGQGLYYAAAFSPDGRRLATADYHTARVWNVADPSAPLVLDQQPVRDVAFTRDGHGIVTASSDGALRIWDADSSRLLHTWGNAKDPIASVVFSPDMRRVVVRSERSFTESVVTLWDLKTGASKLLRRFQNELWPPVFSSDGVKILVAMPDGSARAWVVDGDGEPSVAWPSLTGAVAAQLGPAGVTMLAIMGDGTARLRRSDTNTDIPLPGLLVRIQAGDFDPRLGGFFSPDGRKLAMVEASGVVRIWQTVQPGEPVVIPVSQTDRRLVFSPDGTQLAAVSIGRPSRVSNAEGRGDPLELDDGKIMMSGAIFSPDGSRLVTLSENVAHLWRVRWRVLIDYLRSNTNACLSAEQRRQWLAESQDDATTASNACEARLRASQADSSRSP